jgi:heat shock protein HslJ
MNKKFPLALVIALVIILIGAAVVLAQFVMPKSQPAAAGGADPQKLLIPRWFLSALTLDGQVVSVPAGQQQATIQFEPDGKANGNGGCNSFGANYTAGKDGKLTITDMMSTMMACDNMDLETPYFQALSKVQKFNVADGKLTLTSSDGKTTVVFSMPPK